MLDPFNRTINYLRVSVIDRCNLRCTYCMPENGIKLFDHNQIISYEEICKIIKTAVSLGVNKIKLTGGEPLIRKNIVQLVEMIAKIDGIEDFGMTTNATLLPIHAAKLKEAGLHRLNISMDTLDPKKYKELTRGGDISQLFAGVDAALAVGFKKIKLNCVINKSKHEEDAKAVADYAHQNNFEIRYIQKMSLKNGHFSIVDGGTGGNCKICNRLRLSSDGKIYSCLFNDVKFSTRELGIKSALLNALKYKPEFGISSNKNQFYNIGG